jgi:hypothetical protein
MIDKILNALRSTRFRFTSEAELQEGISQALTAAGILHKTEVILGPRDRVDFWIDVGIALEVKVDGSLSLVTRQLHRYAQYERVNEIILVTSRRLHDHLPTMFMNGKRIHVIVVRGAGL